MRITIIFLLLLLTACNTASKKKNQLAKEMKAFLIPGNYVVQMQEFNDSNIIINSTKGKVKLTNNLDIIGFRGSNSFTDLDSITIRLVDSTVLRQFSINHFVKTVSISADKSGLNEEYFGYIFGEYSSVKIPIIEDSISFADKKNISSSASLFIIGRTEKGQIIIKRVEKNIHFGKTLMDVNKIYILIPNNFS